MTKAQKTCLDCGELSDGVRCPKHAREYEQARGSSTQRGYDVKWRRIQKEAIRLHLERFGQVCPGWGVPAHTATKAELTGDHIISLLDGGESSPKNCGVLCRRCNTRKGGRSGTPPVVAASPSTPPVAPQKRSFLIYRYDK